ncbi:DUF883 family protein [Parvularcula bermudensis]|nr:DUF883 family protein [Parvularcula bermudensis]
MANTARDFPLNREKLAESDVKGDISALQDDLAALRSDLKALFGDAKDYAAEQARRGGDRGKETAEKAKESASEARSAFEDQIREKPLTAVGVALGVGFLVGLIQRR